MAKGTKKEETEKTVSKEYTVKSHSKTIYGKNVYGEKSYVVPEDSFDNEGNTESAVNGTYRTC